MTQQVAPPRDDDHARPFRRRHHSRLDSRTALSWQARLARHDSPPRVGHHHHGSSTQPLRAAPLIRRSPHGEPVGPDECALPGQCLLPGQSVVPDDSMLSDQSMRPDQFIRPGQSALPGQSVRPDECALSARAAPPGESALHDQSIRSDQSAQSGEDHRADPCAQPSGHSGHIGNPSRTGHGVHPDHVSPVGHAPIDRLTMCVSYREFVRSTRLYYRERDEVRRAALRDAARSDLLRRESPRDSLRDGSLSEPPRHESLRHEVSLQTPPDPARRDFPRDAARVETPHPEGRSETPRAVVRPSPRGHQGQRGMVTAEIAIGILTAALVMSVLVWGINLAVVQARCTDTATAVARHLSRGDEALAHEALGQGPRGAQMDTHTDGTYLTVTVSVPVSYGHFPAVTITGSATARLEGT